jgi:putative toxin-antitoxin system antitoxin component (TIGR02293 family)
MIKSEASPSARSAALADLWQCLVEPGPGADAGRARVGAGPIKSAPRSGPVRLSGPLAYSLLKRGISSRAIGPLSDFLGVGKGAVADMLEIDRGTAARWASKDQPLPTHAAEGVLRLIELDQLAIDTFETEAEAMQWLRRPHPMLDGDDPLTAARTSFGAQRVKDILVAIRYGGVA